MQGVPCEIVVTDVAHHSWAICSWTVQLNLSMVIINRAGAIQNMDRNIFLATRLRGGWDTCSACLPVAELHESFGCS